MDKEVAVPIYNGILVIKRNEIELFVVRSWVSSKTIEY